MSDPIATRPPTPYENDAEYLEHELAWLHERAARIAAEKQAEIAGRTACDTAPSSRAGRDSARESRCRAVELRESEQRLRADIDARLAFHRTHAVRPWLGLDALCDSAELSPDERLVLLAAAVPAIGQRIADDVLGDVGTFYGALSVSDLVVLLAPSGPAGWLRARRIFRPDAPLRRHGYLVVGDPRGVAGPDTLLGCEVRLSMSAFGTLVGQPDLAGELSGEQP